MVLFFAFAALTGVQWGQDAAVESSNGVKKTISSADMIKSYCLTILLTIITNLINYGLSVLIMSLVET